MQKGPFQGATVHYQAPEVPKGNMHILSILSAQRNLSMQVIVMCNKITKWKAFLLWDKLQLYYSNKNNNAKIPGDLM